MKISKSQKTNLFFLIFIVLIILGFCWFFGNKILDVFSPQQRQVTDSVPSEFCDPIILDEAKVKFCLDKRLIKDYGVEIIDWRKEKINQHNSLNLYIETKDYKMSGDTFPGSNSWRKDKLLSGIRINLAVEYDLYPWTKGFRELVEKYSKPFYETHDEFPPQKGGKVSRINGIDYIYELKINDSDSWSKGYEIWTHFLENERHFSIEIYASPKSISENDFLLLHDNILKTMKFSLENSNVGKLD